MMDTPFWLQPVKYARIFQLWLEKGECWKIVAEKGALKKKGEPSGVSNLVLLMIG